MAKQDVVLLDCWVSPFCLRVKIALAEKGVEFEDRAEDLMGGKSELLLKSNPHGKVPVLLHNGKPVCESAIIVSYVDETWPSPPLLPSSAHGKAEARFWGDFIDKKVFDAGAAIWRGKGEEVEAAKKDFIEILKQLEGTLAEKEYFGGDSFGYVDILLIGLTSWFAVYEKYGGFSVETECPKLAAWIKKCMLRDTVKNATPAPESVCEFVAGMRTMMGIE